LVISPVLHADMHLERTEPAANATLTTAPKSIRMWFNEVPSAKVSKLELVGPSGPVKIIGPRVIEKSLLAGVDGPMPPGPYTVTWQSAGSDGHLQKGTFKFTVKTGK
jgi:methionine-rich copper-binding protein CopC